jgi:NAD+ kinase
MATAADMRRVYLFGNPSKPHAQEAIERLKNSANAPFEVVGASLGRQIEDNARHADRIVVVGGDGTLIGVARSLGSRQIPLIGVNVGKLGFLAEFSCDDLIKDFDRAVNDDSLISRRAALDVQIENGGVRHSSPAINDCVIQAGPPFRMITLGVQLDGEHLSNVAGDGLIVCTPSGSTAHNLSAGGPIVEPGVDAMIMTPLNPHSLTHKPIVVHRESKLEITALTVNEGTTAIIDGQEPHPLRSADRVIIRRFAHDFLLVRNPKHGRWHNLVKKLHWGQPPTYE